jgi:hypothetical protein
MGRSKRRRLNMEAQKAKSGDLRIMFNSGGMLNIEVDEEFNCLGFIVTLRAQGYFVFDYNKTITYVSLDSVDFFVFSPPDNVGQIRPEYVRPRKDMQ